MRFRITANQVTFARLILMPGVCAMIYGGETARLWAVILGTLVGCTDFVDGYLARRQGPTVLGGLMDPIADKVFIAIGFLPFADLGLVTWWLVSALFLREFLVTALRSSFELRQRNLKSTYLAKVKTWVQMVGLGLLMLLRVVHSRDAMLIVFGVWTALPIIGAIVFKLITGKFWRGAVVGSAGFAILLGTYAMYDTYTTNIVTLVAMLAFTWVSAIDYVVIGAKEVLRDLHAFDFARLAGAAVLPFVSVLVLVRTDADAWPIITVVALEFAHGGLDNLLAHHGVAAGAGVWGARLALVCGFYGVALILPEQASLLSLGALATSTAATAVTFYRQRRFYLEEKLREKKRAPAAQAATS